MGGDGGPASGSNVITPRAWKFAPAAAMRAAELRGETLDQVLDRNVGELLQELRVAFTGVQILFPFLAGLAFASRFSHLAGLDVSVYKVALMTSAVATMIFLAPVSLPRIVFR